MEWLRGGWFPDQWDVPLAIGLGVVVTGYLGDTVASFVSQWVPANWLNPVSEIIIGIVLFALGGFIGGGMSRWLRLFSFGAFAVGIADAISVALGLTASPIRVHVPARRSASPSSSPSGVGFA